MEKNEEGIGQVAGESLKYRSMPGPGMICPDLREAAW